MAIKRIEPNGWITIESDDGLGGFILPPDTPEVVLQMAEEALGLARELEVEFIDGTPAAGVPRGIFADVAVGGFLFSDRTDREAVIKALNMPILIEKKGPIAKRAPRAL